MDANQIICPYMMSDRSIRRKPKGCASMFDNKHSHLAARRYAVYNPITQGSGHKCTIANSLVYCNHSKVYELASELEESCTTPG